MDTLYLVCLFLVAGFSITGILAQCFDDNLLQRTGLSLIGFSAAVEVWQTMNVMSCYQLENVRQLSDIGIVIYGIGTTVKVYRYRHHK